MSDTQTIYIKGALKSSYNATEKDDNGNIKSSHNIITIFKEGATDGDDKDINKFFDVFYNCDSFKLLGTILSTVSSYNASYFHVWRSLQ